MRISDWSSDVCSSDLAVAALRGAVMDMAIELADVGEGGADAFAQHDARAVVDAKAEGLDIALQQLALGAGAQVVEAQLIGLHVGVVGEDVEVEKVVVGIAVAVGGAPGVGLDLLLDDVVAVDALPVVRLLRRVAEGEVGAFDAVVLAEGVADLAEAGDDVVVRIVELAAVAELDGA